MVFTLKQGPEFITYKPRKIPRAQHISKIMFQTFINGLVLNRHNPNAVTKEFSHLCIIHPSIYDIYIFIHVYTSLRFSQYEATVLCWNSGNIYWNANFFCVWCGKHLCMFTSAIPIEHLLYFSSIFSPISLLWCQLSVDQPHQARQLHSLSQKHGLQLADVT